MEEVGVLSLVPSSEAAAMAAQLMQARQTILPKRLAAPGPDAQQLQAIVAAAAHAPDHGQLLPWRFVRVPQAQRARLAKVFAAALLERDAAALPEQVEQAREKAHRSPELLLVVVDGQRGDPAVDLNERILSAGCAVQNLLLMATALGFGSALTSGKALKSDGLRALFGLQGGEHALCFISLGTVLSRKAGRSRPVPADYLTSLV
ncbi:MAG TPA: nitroreductase [Comamonadaceae bacterium]|nr:nitroreductase [Comamonadaceae bacterium]